MNPVSVNTVEDALHPAAVCLARLDRIHLLKN